MKAPEGFTEDKIEPEVWRERFYVTGCLWTPVRQYEYDEGHPISAHFEVFRCWKADDGSLRFYPVNVVTREPDEGWLYASMSIKWDGCSDVEFGEGFGHFCSATEAFETGELLAHIYELARGYFPPDDEEDFMVEKR